MLNASGGHMLAYIFCEPSVYAGITDRYVYIKANGNPLNIKRLSCQILMIWVKISMMQNYL